MFNLFNIKVKLNTQFLLWIIITAFFVIGSVVLLSYTSTAQASSHGLSSSFDGPLVACDGIADCDLCTLLETAQNIITWLVFFSIVVATLMFVYAGFMLVTAGANEGQISKGKGIFWTVFVGLFIVLAAWLIINLIMSTFLNESFGTWYNIDCGSTFGDLGGVGDALNDDTAAGDEVVDPAPIISPIVVVPPAITNNICYEQVEKFLKLTTGGDYVECAEGSAGCTRKNVALTGGTYADNSECSVQCSFVCSDPTSLTQSDPTVLIDPTVIVVEDPNSSITASSFTIVSGLEESTISWSSTSGSSCTGSGDGFNTSNNTSGSDTVSPSVTSPGTFDYSVTCTNAAGTSDTATTQIYVTPQAREDAINGYIYEVVLKDPAGTTCSDKTGYSKLGAQTATSCFAGLDISKYACCVYSPEVGVMSHGQALQELQAEGISVVSSGNCSNPANGNCTSLSGIREDTLLEVIALKDACNCTVVVTGGTETGHEEGTFSHANGYKVDVDDSAGVTDYVLNNCNSLGISGGVATYDCGGAVYRQESDHWDILVA